MTSEGLALLRNLTVDRLVMCEPARAQDRVVQIGPLDQRRRVAIGVQHAAIPLARHLAVDAHRADENQSFHTLGMHGVDDGTCLLRHRSC